MPGSAQNRMQIFALDDDELWLRSSARLFARRGAQITTFTRPEDALEALREQRFVLGMIDYHLGRGWTGAMFAEQAKRTLGAQCPPLLLISGLLEQVSAEDRSHFVNAYPKATPAQSIVDEVFATIAEAAKASLSSHSQLRAFADPDQQKRSSTPDE